MEAVLGYLTWKAGLAVAVALFAALKMRRAKKAADAILDLQKAISEARADKKWTKDEVVAVAEKAVAVAQSLSPLVIWVFKKIR